MVKALSFKGDKKVKKRKRDGAIEQTPGPHDNNAFEPGTARNDDDTWVTPDGVSDLAGPVILILPTIPPSVVATDANGKIYASELENLVEGDPSSAEPHDVRQVWVANRVAGGEIVTLKGHHGRYLRCDKFGILSATKEAISPEESFMCVASPDEPGTFIFQTSRQSFLTIGNDQIPSHVNLRGDADISSLSTNFRIRMQARFKPRLKVQKEEKAREKISRKELEDAVGRRLQDEEVKKLKKARKEGNYHEAMLDVKVKNKHDKFA